MCRKSSGAAEQETICSVKVLPQMYVCSVNHTFWLRMVYLTVTSILS